MNYPLGLPKGSLRGIALVVVLLVWAASTLLLVHGLVYERVSLEVAIGAQGLSSTVVMAVIGWYFHERKGN